MADLHSSAVSMLIDAGSSSPISEMPLSSLETVSDKPDVLPVAPSVDEQLPTQAEPATNANPLDVSTISQTVLKLAPAATSSSASFEASSNVVGAMQRLIEMIARLRSPNSGWSPNLPQTPEMLVPYVAEEVCDLLDALQEHESQIQPFVKTDLNQPLWSNYVQIKALAPCLLWAIARSTYAAMHLLEGLAVNVFQPEQGWQTGILRLVATLSLDMPEATWSLDLATFQPAQHLLSSDAMIQASDSEFCSEPTWVRGVLQSLMQQAQTTTPVINCFIEGVPVEVLIPGADWQSGKAWLQLEFEFIADTSIGAIGVEREVESLNVPQSETQHPCVEAAPVVKFTDAAWIQRYTAIAAQHQLANILPCLHAFQTIERSCEAIAQMPSVALVESACEAADWVQHSLTTYSRNFPQREWAIEALRLRLLWCIGRGAYEVMQLMGGIRASVLQPGTTWESGTLRLLICLELQTTEREWKLDLMTGQPLQCNSSNQVVLAERAIAQSNAIAWCYQPELLKQLSAQALHYITHVTPEVQLLMDGTYIDLQNPDGCLHPGTIQISTRFEFIPSKTI